MVGTGGQATYSVCLQGSAVSGLADVASYSYAIARHVLRSVPAVEAAHKSSTEYGMEN